MERSTFLRRLGALATAAPAFAPARLGAAPTAPRAAAGPIRLGNNENPRGMVPAAWQAVLDGVADVHRYSFPHREPVVEALARRHGAPAASIVLGNGSTEVNQMVIQSLLFPGYRLVAPEPTYEDVTRYSRPHGAELVQVPLTARWELDLDAMEKAALAVPGPVLFYVCNPNNPTATVTPADDVEAVIRRAPERVTFLIDEAYFEFAADPRYRSLDRLALELPNVVVARTFSKIYGMAGLRLGYALAQPGTARRVQAMAAATNTNHLALAAGLVSLEQGDPHVRDSIAENHRARVFTESVLDELGLERLPSHGNFLMHRIEGDLPTYIRRMREADILVGRPFAPLLQYNRLSLGTVAEMEAFAERLRDFRAKGWV